MKKIGVTVNVELDVEIDNPFNGKVIVKKGVETKVRLFSNICLKKSTEKFQKNSQKKSPKKIPKKFQKKKKN